MRLSLRTLPVELQLLIVDDLIESGCMTALFEWSRTCSFYRHILAPYVFRSATFVNTEERVADLLSFSEGKYGHLIESLIFRTSFPDQSNNSEAIEQIANIFPAGALKLLTSLRRFPRLRELTIDLPLMLDGVSTLEEFMDRIDSPGSWERSLRYDRRRPGEPKIWHAVTAKTYEVLSSCMKDRIRSLHIKGLKPRDAWSFRSKPFERLLRQLQRFEISIFGPNSHQSWMLDKSSMWPGVADYQFTLLPSFEALVGSFDVFFFNHLHNVTDVVLCGHQLGQLGAKGENPNRLGLGLTPSQMPLLNSIYLSETFISSEIVAFFLGHSATLESITLKDCIALPEAELAVNWCDLFKSLSNGKMTQLRNFTHDQKELPWSDEVKRILDGKRVFMYSYIDLYGPTCVDYEQIFESYKLGEDQRAYEKLMQFVGDNACTSRIDSAESH